MKEAALQSAQIFGQIKFTGFWQLTLESGIDLGPTVINLAFFSRPYGLINPITCGLFEVLSHAGGVGAVISALGPKKFLNLPNLTMI